MAKQRQSAVPAAVMHLAKPRWQAKSRATLRALLPANSRVMRRALLQANAGEDGGLAFAAASAGGWRPPLLEPQD